ncbi:MAG TPA: response regulator transcription factor [Gemmatimonadales bacterium]|nr:response regulator transcription factor [Gemmatimonadales bacterium]
MIRVLVVAPTARARTSLEAVLREDKTISVMGTGASSTPDVIVLDPGSESGHAIPQLLAQSPNPDAPLVVLLDDLDGEAAVAAIRAGARAALPEDAPPAKIRAAVHAAAAGLASLPANVATALLPSSDGAQTAPRINEHVLTSREEEILALLGEGLASKEIGVRLGISEHTVKTHLTAIYEKLGVSNRAEAVATGLRRGIIML